MICFDQWSVPDKFFFKWSCFCGLVGSLWKILFILLLCYCLFYSTCLIYCSMFKVNICKIKERQFRQVPNLKSYILKEPNLWIYRDRSLPKTDRYFIITVLWHIDASSIQLFFSFLFNQGLQHLQRWGLSNLFSWVFIRLVLLFHFN